MSARRCSFCGINYPSSFPVQCPVHDEPTTYDNSLEPDEDWEERAAEIAQDVARTIEDAFLVPELDDDALFVQDGRLFVFSWDVVERGIGHRLGDGALLRVGTKVYEIAGYIDAMRAYWVTVFRMYLTDRDVNDLGNPKSRRRKRHK